MYKSALIKEIADLVDKGALDGIADIQDESDRRGMRIAIEVKRGADAQVVLNNLLKHSRLQTRFSANMVALVDHRPQQLTLKRMLQAFIDFRLQARGASRHVHTRPIPVGGGTCGAHHTLPCFTSKQRGRGGCRW